MSTWALIIVTAIGLATSESDTRPCENTAPMSEQQHSQGVTDREQHWDKD